MSVCRELKEDQRERKEAERKMRWRYRISQRWSGVHASQGREEETLLIQCILLAWEGQLTSHPRYWSVSLALERLMQAEKGKGKGDIEFLRPRDDVLFCAALARSASHNPHQPLWLPPRKGLALWVECFLGRCSFSDLPLLISTSTTPTSALSFLASP